MMRYSDFKKQAARIQQDKTLKQAEKTATNPQPMVSDTPEEKTTTKTVNPATGEETTTTVTKPATQPAAPQGQAQDGGFLGFVGGAVNTAKEKLQAGKEKVDKAIKGYTQHNELLETNEAYNKGFNDPSNPIKLDKNTFNSDEWRKLQTDEERTAYITKLMQDWGYNKAGIAARENGLVAAAKNPDIVPRDLGGVLKNDANYKELQEALSHGDMEFLNYMQRMQAAMGEENASSYFKTVWASIPEEKQQELLGTMRTAAWNNIKADPLVNLPKVIGLWFKMKGWDQMGEFAQDPLKFYLSLAGILGGGLVLGSMAFGGGSDEQPVVINNGAQQNPYYSGTL